MARINHVAIAERAAPQLGLITSSQLAELGASPRQIVSLRESGLLRRVHRGVYALSGSPASSHQRLLAATLHAGDGAVASHLAAAWVWGFDGIVPTCIELSVPGDRRPRTDRAVVHRMSNLLSVDVTMRGPQPVTTPARTILDIAGLVPEHTLEEALDGARRRGQLHVPFLAWRLAELRGPGCRGVTALDALLERDRTSSRAESWLESAFLRLIRDAWLPPPRVQVVKRDGRHQMRLDAYYDDQLLVAEVGGHATHSTRRQRQRDAERRARLVAAGLRVVDFTAEDVRERPRYVAATLGRLLGLEPYLHHLTG
jgi:very-short-patch-repair endonuclease